jgi:hypothetical protein
MKESAIWTAFKGERVFSYRIPWRLAYPLRFFFGENRGAFREIPDFIHLRLLRIPTDQ